MSVDVVLGVFVAVVAVFEIVANKEAPNVFACGKPLTVLDNPPVP